jgi:hypothetical protein
MDMDTDVSEAGKNKLSEAEANQFEQVEEGWTFVTKSGKHLTKN